MNRYHIPVLADAVISGLNINPAGIYVDGTCGFGGHAIMIAERINTGRLIAVDRDGDAICETEQRLAPHADKVTVVRDNFNYIPAILDDLSINFIDGCLLDLGVSSYQLDTPGRGFSYIRDCPLDMRMDDRQAVTAAEIVNTYDENTLADILYINGEERHARRIARAIVNKRCEQQITTTGELVHIIESAVPEAAKKKATRR